MTGSQDHYIGIDEAGRGPLAGPVALGAVMMTDRGGDFWFTFEKELRDSKKLSPQKRQLWFERIEEAREKFLLNYVVVMVGPKTIDEKGISSAIAHGVDRCLIRLKADPSNCHLVLDGRLKGPERFFHQESVVGGDAKVPIIALASIAAKVIRDREMVRQADLWPGYGFDRHKGYGTEFHRQMIKKRGPCPIHRRSFTLY